MMDDLISRQAAINIVVFECGKWTGLAKEISKQLKQLPSAQPESTRTFVELVVEYPDPELCTYKEYKGKPYYSIKYIENGEKYVGYGTYNPDVLSKYLKEYFMPSAQPEIVRCKDCKHRPEKVMHGYKGTARGWYLLFPDEECPCENFDDEWYSYMPKDDWFCPNGERAKA